MAVSCGLIKLAKNLTDLERLERQIMKGSTIWICAFKKRMDLGGEISLDRLKEFPGEFSVLISSIQSKRRRVKKEGYLRLKEKIKNKTLTFEELKRVVITDKRFGIPKKIFYNYFILMFDEIDDYSQFEYNPVWMLADYFQLFESKKYDDWNKYLRYRLDAFNDYENRRNKEIEDIM